VWTLWFYAFSMLFAPYVFNPQSLSINTIFVNFEELCAWYAGSANHNNKDHRGSWKIWHTARLATPRGEATLGKILDHTRIFVLRFVLLLPIAARLEMASDSVPSYRVLLLLLAGALLLAAQLLIYLLCARRGLAAPIISGLEYGAQSLAVLYRVIIVCCVIAGFLSATEEIVKPYCDMTWAGGGRANAGLLIFAAMLLSTYFLQLFATLSPPADGACFGLGRIKKWLVELADFYYFAMDVFLSASLIFALSVLAMLPLLRLQSIVLFNRGFARVISAKLSRAALLKRILS
jgi:hypothetical protein